MAFQNLDRVRARLRAYGQGVRAGAQAGVETEAHRVLERARELVPTGEGPNKGLLRDSGKVVVTDDGAAVIFDAVDANGRAMAVKVHEVAAYHDDGQWKYLQRAVDELESSIPRGIAAAAQAGGRRRAR